LTHCHAEGREFESRRSRHKFKPSWKARFFDFRRKYFLYLCLVFFLNR